MPMSSDIRYCMYGWGYADGIGGIEVVGIQRKSLTLVAYFFRTRCWFWFFSFGSGCIRACQLMSRSYLRSSNNVVSGLWIMTRASTGRDIPVPLLVRRFIYQDLLRPNITQSLHNLQKTKINRIPECRNGRYNVRIRRYSASST